MIFSRTLIFCCVLFSVLGGVLLHSTDAQAGWKTKAVLVAGGALAGHAVKKCITNTCPKAVMSKIDDYLIKNPGHRDYLVSKFQDVAVNKYPHLLKSDAAKIRYRKMLTYLRGDAKRKSGVPSGEVKIHPSVDKPYKRPASAGPVKQQQNSAQGKPCVDCGEITKRQVADHKDPLVVEYYRDGKVDVPKQRSVEAVQPHCPKCSSQQGGQLGSFGKKMKKLLNSKDGDK